MPPVSTEPPANPDPPAEPLAEPAAQPAVTNQLIFRFWCIFLVPSFSYPLYNAFRVFSSTFGLFPFLASFATTLFSIFNIPPCPSGLIFVFLCLLLLVLFVQVFHFSCSFLFWLVCVPFGSGSRLCLEQDIFVSAVRNCSSPESRFCFRKNCFGYTVKDHSSL